MVEARDEVARAGEAGRRHPLGSWPGLVLCLLVCQGTGALGSLAMTEEAMVWYRSLDKPPITPPGWVIGAVWTVLYGAMAVSLWLVLRRWHEVGPRRRRRALGVFLAQLVLNGLWTALFFGLQRPWPALVEMLALLGLIVWTALLFRRFSRAAAWLLVPYALWVSFATVLTGWFLALGA